MPTIFLFHGVGGHSQENWLPWLKAELERKSYDVIVPDFPHPDHPVLSEWSDCFRQYDTLIDEHTIFVGHSLGGAFVLRLLEQMRTSIHACILVASVWGIMGNQFDRVMSTFTEQPYDWNAIRQNANHFSVIHSDNDPFIKLSQAEQLAKHLGISMTLVRGGGHFNASAGYSKFPFLLEQITAAS